MTQGTGRRYSRNKQLRQAFDGSEFVLHYQPVLRLDDNRLVGAEALLRWNHPSDGLVPSALFVRDLDETGMIGEVGCWVVREAVRQIGSWRTLYGRNIVEWVGINLSARQLREPSDLLGTLQSIHAGRFPVHRLKFEAPEDVLVREPQIVAAILGALRGLGIGFAIDDCGLRETSLEVVRAHGIDTVKIDSALIARIGTAEGETLLRAMVEDAEAAEIAVVAKGLETPEQRAFLRGAGCGFGQGYLLGEPMEGAQLGVFALTHAVHSDSAQSDIRRSVTGRLIRRGA